MAHKYRLVLVRGSDHDEQEWTFMGDNESPKHLARRAGSSYFTHWPLRPSGVDRIYAFCPALSPDPITGRIALPVDEFLSAFDKEKARVRAMRAMR